MIFRVLSHEIRTPLTSMQLVLDRFRDLYDELPEQGQQHLARLLGSFRDLAQVINRSLGQFKGDETLRAIECRTLARELVQKRYQGLVTLEFEEPEIAAAPSEAESSDDVDDADDSGEIWVHGSRFWLTICLQNLLSNALTHGEPPVRLRVEAHGGDAILEVEDAGTLPASFRGVRTPVFSMYKNPTGKGMGIGLDIVRRKMLEADGRLEYQTSPTRFRLILRRIKPSANHTFS